MNNIKEMVNEILNIRNTMDISIAPSYDEDIDEKLKSLGYVEQMIYEIIDDNLYIKDAM
jgi:hypothetical protein